MTEGTPQHDSEEFITAYELDTQICEIVPAPSRRDWMDHTRDRFAYRCLPMTIANSCGWQVLCPASFVASWNGGTRHTSDITIVTHPGDPQFVQSHFRNGILTFHTGYVFRTSTDVNLWVRGPVNHPKARVHPLEGIVETDWTSAPFTMNWVFTEPGAVEFEKGEPFCSIFPYPRSYIERFDCKIASLSSDPETSARYKEWALGRAEFLHELPDRSSLAHQVRWQKDYTLGRGGVADEPSSGHQTKLMLKPFRKEP
jgi:hypothetical protein